MIAIDTDLGRIEWQKTLPGAPSKSGSLDCPGGMTANVANPVTAAFPTVPGIGGGGGRNLVEKSLDRPPDCLVNEHIGVWASSQGVHRLGP